jgi:hypothetical protein
LIGTFGDHCKVKETQPFELTDAVLSASAWDPLHPGLTRRSAWKGHDGELPIVEGAVVRLKVDRCPAARRPRPDLAVDVDHRRRPRLRRPGLALLPAKIRARTHVPPF